MENKDQNYKIQDNSFDYQKQILSQPGNVVISGITNQLQNNSNQSQNNNSIQGNVKKRFYRQKNTEKIKRWTLQEHELYQRFVQMYSDIMKNSSSKRNTKIFLLMSKFIITKTPSQCRSHHQKFYGKIKSYNNIQGLQNLMNDNANMIKQENQNQYQVKFLNNPLNFDYNYTMDLGLLNNSIQNQQLKIQPNQINYGIQNMFMNQLQQQPIFNQNKIEQNQTNPQKINILEEMNQDKLQFQKSLIQDFFNQKDKPNIEKIYWTNLLNQIDSLQLQIKNLSFALQKKEN